MQLRAVDLTVWSVNGEKQNELILWITDLQQNWTVLIQSEKVSYL